MRSLRTLLLGILLVALAACGGGPASSSADESTGGDSSTAASQSEQAAESPAESEDGGGPGSVDMDTLLDELVPPNSDEISRTEAGTSVLIGYESTDSVGDLKAFYVQKIAQLGLTTITTTEAANTWAIAFGIDNTGAGLGGTVAIQNAGDVSNVVVTVAESPS